MPAKLLYHLNNLAKALPKIDYCFRLSESMNIPLFCMSMTGLSIAAATVRHREQTCRRSGEIPAFPLF